MTNLKKLQKWLVKNNIDSILINRTDEFLNEYVATYAERLRWVSNFSGSVGKAIVFVDKAVLFVDGRYSIQAKKETNSKDFLIKKLSLYPSWLKKNLKNNLKIAIDPSLISINEFNFIRKITLKYNINFKLLHINPIDLLWKKQPNKPSSQAFLHPDIYSGETAEKKIRKIKSILNSKNCDYYFLSSLDSIAWLLNIRGNDINFTPLNLSYLIISKHGKSSLFIKLSKVKKIKNKLKKFVNLINLDQVNKYLENITSNKTIGFDKSNTSLIFKTVSKKNKLNIKYFEDPCIYLKAKKNKTELNGAINSNIRESLSFTKFLFWIKNHKTIEKINEISAEKKLLSIKKKNKLFYSLSFETISATGKNSASPHYFPSTKKNFKLKKNSIYLIDSGSQYLDGTTDITRTIILGKPTSEQTDRFTRVLKGHIAVASCVFKENSNGNNIDYLARKSLKEVGCDYEHGTGHGVGSFLSVHEGPQRITKSFSKNKGKIIQNMIISNEPGFYKQGHYGIRIENLLIVKKNKHHKLKFETISYVPIDNSLIKISLLNSNEINWINQYHKKIFKILNQKLNSHERIWLKEVTKPIIY